MNPWMIHNKKQQLAQGQCICKEWILLLLGGNQVKDASFSNQLQATMKQTDVSKKLWWSGLSSLKQRLEKTRVGQGLLNLSHVICRHAPTLNRMSLCNDSNLCICRLWYCKNIFNMSGELRKKWIWKTCLLFAIEAMMQWHWCGRILFQIQDIGEMALEVGKTPTLFVHRCNWGLQEIRRGSKQPGSSY